MIELTRHARQRMAEMGVTPRQVEDVITRPQRVDDDPVPGRLRYIGQHLLVVVAPDDAVVTVALNTHGGRYQRPEALRRTS